MILQEDPYYLSISKTFLYSKPLLSNPIFFFSEIVSESVNEKKLKFDNFDKFHGNDFRHWKKKMHFLLTTLKVLQVLSTPLPKAQKIEMMKQTRCRWKWDNDDYIYKGHSMNDIFDAFI